MQTGSIRDHWIQTCHRCGLGEAETFGLAFVLALRLTTRTTEDYEPNLALISEFIGADEWRDVGTRISSDEIVRVVQWMKYSRHYLLYEADRNLGDNSFWQPGDDEEAPERLDASMEARCRFDLVMFEAIGNSLEASNRTVACAFGMAENFNRMSGALSEADALICYQLKMSWFQSLSPIAAFLTKERVIVESKGFVGYLPIEIALGGLLSGGDRMEFVWNLLKAVIYSQPGGVLFRPDFHDRPLNVVLLETNDLLFELVSANREHALQQVVNVDSSYFVASNERWDYLKSQEDNFLTYYPKSGMAEESQTYHRLCKAATCHHVAAMSTVMRVCNAGQDFQGIARITTNGRVWHFEGVSEDSFQNLCDHFRKLLRWRGAATYVLFLPAGERGTRAFLIEPDTDGTFNDVELAFSSVISCLRPPGFAIGYTPISSYTLDGCAFSDKVVAKLMICNRGEQVVTLVHELTYIEDSGFTIGRPIGVIQGNEHHNGSFEFVRNALMAPIDDETAERDQELFDRLFGNR